MRPPRKSRGGGPGGDSRRERGHGHGQGQGQQRQGRPQRSQQQQRNRPQQQNRPQQPSQQRPAGPTTQLFFAAWPAAEIQEALGGVAQRAQRECGGQATPVHNIHLTLVFLGPVAYERLIELERLAEKVSAPRFALAVDRVEYWRHNNIAWAGFEECPEALRALVGQLEKTLAAEGFHPDQRPYVTHVTLLRDARRAPAQGRLPQPVAWPVEEFVLVESVQLDNSRVYEVLHRWPLTGS